MTHHLHLQAEKVKSELHDLRKDLLIEIVGQCQDVLALSTCNIQCQKEDAGKYRVIVTKDSKCAGIFVVEKTVNEEDPFDLCKPIAQARIDEGIVQDQDEVMGSLEEQELDQHLDELMEQAIVKIKTVPKHKD